jgi:hypothetical protein
MDILLLAQDVAEPIPAELFNWFVGIAVAIVTAMAAAITALWLRKGVTSEDRKNLALLPALAANVINQTQIDNLNQKLITEQSERRQDIERLVGEQKDLMVSSLGMNNKLSTSLDGVKTALERVETTLKEQE